MKFDYEAISSSINELITISREISNIFDDFESQINKITNSAAWQGPGANSFVNRAKKTLTVGRNYEESLKQIIAYIENCSADYKGIEDKLAELMAQTFGK